MIEELRSEIDEIDEKIVELLNRRARSALKIGRLKNEKDRDVTDRQREANVLAQIKRWNAGPFADDQLARIYRRIISESKDIQLEVDADDSRDEAGGN